MGKKQKTPWSTKAVMAQIYDKHLWGGKEYDFYSGFGSHSPEIVKPYINAVKKFLKSFDENLSVIDLGCGDFNIGNQIAAFTKHYTGIDIVSELIERNKTNFTSNNIEFLCLDISKDTLPKADCVILRNVLQHLSNNEIQNILDKLKPYRYLILTEHIPNGIFNPNLDIIAGQGIRLKQNSGVDILKSPFNFHIKEKKTLAKIILGDKKGLIITQLITIS